jgi:hypothetical protein
MVYQWAQGAPSKGLKAQIIGEHLESLREASGGLLTSRGVLDDAKRPKSPTHAYFEWNNAKAALAHRLQQAAQLLATVTIIVRAGDANGVQRAFVVVSEHGASEAQEFTSLSVAMSNPLTREVVIRRARAELDSWTRRYKELTEFQSVVEAIERLSA